MDPSPRTRALLCATLGRDLAGLVYEYFAYQGGYAYSRYLAVAGNYEACMSFNFRPNSILVGACRGGYPMIIELAIERGATNLNLGFGSACRADNRDIMYDMMERGADYCMRCGTDANEHWN